MDGHAQPEDGNHGAVAWVGLDGSVPAVWVIQTAEVKETARKSKKNLCSNIGLRHRKMLCKSATTRSIMDETRVRTRGMRPLVLLTCLSTGHKKLLEEIIFRQAALDG